MWMLLALLAILLGVVARAGTRPRAASSDEEALLFERAPALPRSAKLAPAASVATLASFVASLVWPVALVALLLLILANSALRVRLHGTMSVHSAGPGLVAPDNPYIEIRCLCDGTSAARQRRPEAGNRVLGRQEGRNSRSSDNDDIDPHEAVAESCTSVDPSPIGTNLWTSTIPAWVPSRYRMTNEPSSASSRRDTSNCGTPRMRTRTVMSPAYVDSHGRGRRQAVIPAPTPRACFNVRRPP